MIRFACPSCGKVYKAPDENAGRKTVCKQCNALVVIPDQAVREVVQGVPLPTNPAGETAPAPIKPPPQRPAVETHTSPGGRSPPSAPSPSPFDFDDAGQAESTRPATGYHAWRRDQSGRHRAAWAWVVGLGLSLTVLLSLVAGWPFSVVRKQLPVGVRKADTLAEIVEHLKDKRIVLHTVYLEPSRETAGHPGYLLFGNETQNTAAQCCLLEFESERDIDLFFRLILTAGGGGPELESKLKQMENNSASGVYKYGRFLFMVVTGPADFLQKIRLALR